MEVVPENGPKSSISDVLRKKVEYYRGLDQHETAVFWCEQLLSCPSALNEEHSLSDRIDYIQSLIASKYFSRAISYILNNELRKKYKDPLLTYLYAEALALSGSNDQAIEILSKLLINNASGRVSDIIINQKANLSKNAGLNRLSDDLKSRGHLLLAKCYLSVENRESAGTSLQECLRLDPDCVEALDLIIQESLLTSHQLNSFIHKHIPLQTNDDFHLLRKSLYLAKVGIDVVDWTDLSAKTGIEESLSMKCAEAERLFDQRSYLKAYRIMQEIFAQEDLYWDAVGLQVGILVELKKENELFKLAHRLVDNHPDSSLSWYAVGAYYYLLSNYDAAKKFLLKMSGMRPVCGRGWLLLGHSFAEEQEHDQSINCYLKTSKLVPGSYLPLLYIGVEYGLSRNFTLSVKFLKQSLEMSGQNGTVLNELGVVYMREGYFKQSEKYLLQALTAILPSDHPYFNKEVELENVEEILEKAHLNGKLWESVLTNLGSVIRQRKKSDLAVKTAILCQKHALMSNPRDSNLIGALGVSYLFAGDLDNGITCLTQAMAYPCASVGVYRNLLTTAMESVKKEKLTGEEGDIISAGDPLMDILDQSTSIITSPSS